MRKPLTHATTAYGRSTPQSMPIPGSTQTRNSAGGYSWKVDKWEQLRRFLVLGTEGGTYYASEKKLTLENAKSVLDCVAEDGVRAVAEATRISRNGLAHKNTPALYVMAFAISYGTLETRKAVADNLNLVARTGTHLFEFVGMATEMRGWGSLLKRAVFNWYHYLPTEDAAFQVTKYAQREGWSHLDTMRLARPLNLTIPAEKELYDFVNGQEITEFTDTPSGHYLEAVQEVKTLNPENGKELKRLLALIEEKNLPREVLPTSALNHPDVWRTMLPRMPLTATIRNLGKMSELGLFKQIASPEVRMVQDKLQDGEYIHRSRVHPMTLFFALKTYSGGVGFRSAKAWPVNRKIADALDGAFYLAFKNVVPSGKRMLLAVDVSGSMTWGGISGTNITPREAAAALTLVIANTEENVVIKGFSTTFSDLKISPKQRLDDVIKYMGSLSFGGTDCALPMIWATKEGVEVDAFVTLTDSETWAGKMQPAQALRNYRSRMNLQSKSIVVGMISSGFTIADPEDSGSLDVVGFSADTPAVISDFSRGF